MSRYVPPHLRKKSGDVETTNNTSENVQPKSEELMRRKLSDLKVQYDQNHPTYTLNEIHKHYGSTSMHSTLHDTTSKPGELGLVILFHNANPRWRADRIIFAHTNIDILPGYVKFKERSAVEKLIAKHESAHNTVNEPSMASQEDSSLETNTQQESKSNNHSGPIHDPKSNTSTSKIEDTDSAIIRPKIPIPIFTETSRFKNRRKYTFHGYFHLQHVEFLAPNSPELVRMLQQKWESNTSQRHSNIPPPSRGKQRDPAAWMKSMGQEWAVLKFKKLVDDESPEEPKIEILDDEEEGGAVLQSTTNSVKKLAGDE